MSIIAWPFVATWKLLAGLIALAGRLVITAVGFALLTGGVILCFTVVGAVAGIPLAAAGLLLMIRGLF